MGVRRRTVRLDGARDYIEAALKGMDAIQRRLDATGSNGLPEAYLLGFDPDPDPDPDGDGRVILANGNPDTADHTAVYVPGTKTDLASIEDELDHGTTLWLESNSLSPGRQGVHHHLVRLRRSG